MSEPLRKRPQMTKQSIIQLYKMPKRVKMKEIGKALEIMPPKL